LIQEHWLAIVVVVRIAEFLFLHFIFHRLASLVLLHVEDLVEVCQEIGIVFACALPVDPLSELLNGTALLQVKVPLPHQPQHLKSHRVLLAQALLVQIDQFLQLLRQPTFIHQGSDYAIFICSTYGSKASLVREFLSMSSST